MGFDVTIRRTAEATDYGGQVEFQGEKVPIKWAKIQMAPNCYPTATIMLDVRELTIQAVDGDLFVTLGGDRFRLVAAPYKTDGAADELIVNPAEIRKGEM